MEILGITSYFNPFHGKLRRENYQTFRKHLGIKLLTVEWSHNGEFDLCEQDADYFVQVSGGGILWQKERLLNIGCAKARELGFSRVVFLDCDIIFTDPDWFHRANSALDSYSIVQCYTHVHYLPIINHSGMPFSELAQQRPAYTMPSLSYEIKRTNSLFRKIEPNSTFSFSNLSGNPGMAIAVRIDQHPDWTHYEGNIVGRGDVVLIAGITKSLDELFSNREFSHSHQSHIRSWHEKHFPHKVHIGVINNSLKHLWHGELENRNYKSRYAILSSREYDPATDLMAKASEPLAFSDRGGRLEKPVTEYLMSRQDF